METIRIDGTIGDWLNTGEIFRERLVELDLKADETLLIILNSMGGSVIEGFSIYNQIKSLENPTITKIEGFACSITALIAMSGDEVQMSEVGQLMIHRASVGLQGDKNELEKQAEILNSIDETQILVFSAKTGLSKKTIENMLDAETWFSAKEAKSDNFIDEVVDKIAAANIYKYAANFNTKNNEGMKNVFKNILAKMNGEKSPTPKPPATKTETVGRAEFDDMKAMLQELIKALADKENETEELTEEQKIAALAAAQKPELTEEEKIAAKAEELRIAALAAQKPELTEEQIKALGLTVEQIKALTVEQIKALTSIQKPELTEEQKIEALATKKFNALIAGLPGSKGQPPAGQQQFSQKPVYVDKWEQHRTAQKELDKNTRLS